MERDEAIAALHTVQQRRQAVHAASRASVTLLIVWGVTAFAVEFATAFLSGPWTLVPVGVLVLSLGWPTVRAVRQQVQSHGFTRRYLVIVGLFSGLHMAYLTLLLVADLHHNVAAALIGSLAVAAPLLVGAYIESRRP
jgi:hypothetical protein